MNVEVAAALVGALVGAAIAGLVAWAMAAAQRRWALRDELAREARARGQARLERTARDLYDLEALYLWEWGSMTRDRDDPAWIRYREISSRLGTELDYLAGPTADAVRTAMCQVHQVTLARTSGTDGPSTEEVVHALNAAREALRARLTDTA